MKNQETIEEKNCMFQYYNGFSMIENTGLITKQEAETLWSKYFEEAKNNLKEGLRVQMCIWSDCNSPTSYHTEYKLLDHYDCIVDGENVYRVTRELITSN